jgi:hypothetical protein
LIFATLLLNIVYFINVLLLDTAAWVEANELIMALRQQLRLLLLCELKIEISAKLKTFKQLGAQSAI